MIDTKIGTTVLQYLSTPCRKRQRLQPPGEPLPRHPLSPSPPPCRYCYHVADPAAQLATAQVEEEGDDVD